MPHAVHTPPRPRRRPTHGRRATPRLTALALLAASLASAQAQTWTGGGVTGLWSDLFNWAGFNPPSPSVSTSVVFDSSARLTSFQNLGSVFSLNALTFASGAGAYTLSGGAFGFVGTNARLVHNGGSQVKIFNNVQLNDDLAITTSGAGALELAGGLTRVAPNRDTLTLTKQGAGTLILSTASDYDAVLRVNAGQVQVRHLNALQFANVDLAAANGLSFSNLAGARIGTLIGSGAMDIGTTALTLIGGDSPGVYAGAITGSTGSVRKNGSGTARWTGVSQFDNLRAASGRLQLEGGSVTLTNTNEGLFVGGGSASDPLAGVLALSGGARLTASGTTAQVDGAAGTLLSITGNATVNTGFQALVGNHAVGTLQVDTGGTLNAATYLGIGYDNGGTGVLRIGGTGTVNSDIGMLGVLTGAKGTAEVVGTGALWATNTLTIGGFDDVRRGGTGTLTVRDRGQVRVAGGMSFWSGAAKVTVAGSTLRAGWLSSETGRGSIDLQSGPLNDPALLLGGGADASYGGALQGSGGLRKDGSGAQTLAGANMGFTGTTTIRGGQIVTGHTLALARSRVQLDVDNGLNLNGLSNAAIGALSGTGALNLGSTALGVVGDDPGSVYSGNITGTDGSVTMATGGTTRWTGTSQFSRLQLVNGRMQLDGQLTLTNNEEGLTVGDAVSARTLQPVLTVGNGAKVSALGRTVQVDAGDGTQLGIVGAGSLLTTGFQTLVGNHANGRLVVEGGGRLTAGTYLGMGYDDGGKGALQVGAGGSVTSDVGMLGVLVGATGTADVAGSGAQWATNRLTIGGFNDTLRGGNGTLSVRDGGVVRVRDAVSFWSDAASITVDGGTLRAGTLSSASGKGRITLQSDPAGAAALVLEGAADDSFAGVLAGAGTLLKTGTGRLTLSGLSSTFTGSTTIRGGQIILGRADALRASAVRLEVDNGLNLNGFTIVTLGSIAGTGAQNLGFTRLVLTGDDVAGLYSGALNAASGHILKTGTGTLRLSGTSSIDNLQLEGGRTQLEGGVLSLANTGTGLRVGGNNATASSELAVQAGAKLQVFGTDARVDGGPGTLLHVTGAGSDAAFGHQLVVGNLATGLLRVDGGASVRARSFLSIGQQAGANGTMEIGPGGTAVATSGVVAAGQGATGTVDVAGQAARWMVERLDLGGLNAATGGGNATLTVRNRGLVQADDGLDIWSDNVAITVDGGTLRTGRLSGTFGHSRLTLQADPTAGVALELNGDTDSSFAGILAGSGSLLKTGAARLTLAGASAGFTGTTTVRGGQIILGHQDALRGSAVRIEVDNGLNVNGLDNVVIGSLAGTGALALGNTQLTLGEDNLSTTYAGTFSGAGATLVKKGTGSFTLTGSGSALNRLVVEGGGAVVMTGGDLALSSNSDSAGALTLNAGGRVEVRGTARLSANASGRSSIYLAGDDTTELLIDGAGARVDGGFQTLAGVREQGRITVRNGGSFVGTNALGAGFNDGSNGRISFESGAQGAAPLLLAGILTGSTGQLLVSGSGTVVRATGAVGLGGVSDSQRGGTGHLDISDGGAVITPQVKFWTADSTLRIDGGTLTATRVESAAGAGAITLVSDPADGAALVLGGGQGSYSYGGSIDGDGSVTKIGVTNQVLAGSNSFTGKVSVQGGTLTMGSSAASEYEVGAFGTLRLGERSLGFSVVQAAAGGQVVYTATALNGGTLIGPGGHDITAVRRLVGTRVAGGTVLTPASGTSFVGVVNEGSITNFNGRTLTWTGGSNPSGSVLVAGTTTVSSFTSGGQLTVGPTGTLVSTSGNLVLGGGSRTTLGAINSPGGTIELRAGGRVQVNGGLLVNNGSIAAPVEVNFGGLAKGAGSYGAVFVNDGGRFSPGNSPGSVTTGDAIWGAGGALVVELANAKGTAGWDWDLWNVHGALSIGAGSTANSRFTISLATLDNANAAAPLAGFDAHHSWSWRIVDTDAGILGFDTSKVVLDTQGFLSPLAGGSLRLAVQDGDLYLQYAPVPEPQTWALMLGGLAAIRAWAARRRRAA